MGPTTNGWTAYREKYGRYERIVGTVLDADARASTLRLVLRAA